MQAHPLADVFGFFLDRPNGPVGGKIDSDALITAPFGAAITQIGVATNAQPENGR